TVWNSMFPAELNHCGGARDAQPGFQGSGLVIHSGVNDATIVPALMAGNAVFLFQKQQPMARKPPLNLQPHSKADHAAADDDYVVPRVRHSSGISRSRQADAMRLATS